MRILVSGATGFIGRYLCRMLNDRGHQIVVLSRDKKRALRILPWAESIHEWSSKGGEPDRSAFAEVDAVVNLAGESVQGLWTTAKRREILNSRVTGTSTLISAMKRHDNPPNVFVNASAAGWYGDRGEDLLGEDMLPGKTFLAQVCQEWEEASKVVEADGIRVVNLRTGFVLGSRGGFLGPLVRLYKFALGSRLGSGMQWWSWIHQEDYARLVLFLLEQNVSGPVNACSPFPVRQSEFNKTLGQVLRRPTMLYVPSVVLKVLLGGLSEDLLVSRRVSTGKSEEMGFTFEFPELEPALRDLLKL